MNMKYFYALGEFFNPQGVQGFTVSSSSKIEISRQSLSVLLFLLPRLFRIWQSKPLRIRIGKISKYWRSYAYFVSKINVGCCLLEMNWRLFHKQKCSSFGALRIFSSSIGMSNKSRSQYQPGGSGIHRNVNARPGSEYLSKKVSFSGYNLPKKFQNELCLGFCTDGVEDRNLIWDSKWFEKADRCVV